MAKETLCPAVSASMILPRIIGGNSAAATAPHTAQTMPSESSFRSRMV